MATSSPSSSSLKDALGRLAGRVRPPEWLVGEAQQRLVLFLNHVLMQEPQAQARLAQQRGRALRAQWRDFSLQLAATPAGLLELAPGAKPDLLLAMVDESPRAAMRNVLRGERPAVRIEGDVQFAAVVSWLVENVRWDAEEDLARLIGDVPAHTLAGFARAARQALQKFAAGVKARMPGPSNHAGT
ncbi:MAG: hypothetical protein LBI48_02545 [Burkholderiaceae bacterium]|jgi:ubiquinone biosynthesis protein UbiJ|nr:hypothetical protein [Burkholderiaceae bacterium]